MQWGVLGLIFFFSTFKFMFAAIPGSIAGIPIWQTYIATVSGGIFGAAVFYFGSELFIKWNHARKVRKLEADRAAGRIPQIKKKFTRMNKFVIKIKWKLGIYGITFWAPFFLSVPIGTVVAAKFYGKKRVTFPLIALGMCINGVVTTGLSYLWR